MAKNTAVKRVNRDMRTLRRDTRALAKKRGMGRANGQNVLAQGVAAAPKKAFGTRTAGKKVTKKQLMASMNALVPYTLGLPRAVGPYTVIRTSATHTTGKSFVMFCPLLRRNVGTEAERWYAACGLEDVSSTSAINAADNCRMIPMNLTLGGMADAVPASMTVQIMNGEALQTTTGIFYMGRVSQQMVAAGETRTWDSLRDQFISYFRPRLLSAGKLALRGVQCNALPLDMGDYSNFTGVQNSLSQPFTWEEESTAPACLTPIVFAHSNGASSAEITFLVTMEWRVRFDPSHPAASSHTHHPTTEDKVWDELVGSADKMGHGVVDIAESVAELGEAALTA